MNRSPDPSDAAATIGVFDSGMGGLTVLRALRSALPHHRFLYLGDTARLPWGTKSPETVRRYAARCARALVAHGLQALVVACNTASTYALARLRQDFAPLPVFGVVEPGARAAAAASRSGEVLVLATEGTVAGGAYVRALLAQRPSLRIHQRACPLFVTLAEDGWIGTRPVGGAGRQRAVDAAAHADLADQIVSAHLRAFRTRPAHRHIDTVVLGCTHFPVLAARIAAAVPGMAVVDSASTTAAVVAEVMNASGATPDHTATAVPEPAPVSYLVTDGVERFVRLAPRFLGAPVGADRVWLVDLGDGSP